MPLLYLETNVPKNKISKEFVNELNQVVADILGKEVTHCRVTINPDMYIVDGEGDGPVGHGTLMSIHGFGENENVKYSKALADKISEIGIPPSRLVITFIDNEPQNVGIDGSTVKRLDYD